MKLLCALCVVLGLAPLTVRAQNNPIKNLDPTGDLTALVNALETTDFFTHEFSLTLGTGQGYVVFSTVNGALVNPPAPTFYAANPPPYVGFLKTVSSVGDGSGTSLEAMPTVSISVPQFVLIYNVSLDEMEGWLLVAGTDPTDNDLNGHPAHQRPLDYNASTNAKVWVRKM